MGAGRYRRMVWRPGCGVRRPCARLGRTNVEGEGERGAEGGDAEEGKWTRVAGGRVARGRCAEPFEVLLGVPCR